MLPYQFVTFTPMAARYPNDIEEEIARQDPDEFYSDNGHYELCLYSPYERQLLRYGLTRESPVSDFFQTEQSACLLPRYLQKHIELGFQHSEELQIVRQLSHELEFVNSHEELSYHHADPVVDIVRDCNVSGSFKIQPVHGMYRMDSDVSLDTSDLYSNKIKIRDLQTNMQLVGQDIARQLIVRILDEICASSTNVLCDPDPKTVAENLWKTPTACLHNMMESKQSLPNAIEYIPVHYPKFKYMLFDKQQLIETYITKHCYMDADTIIHREPANLIISIGALVRLHENSNHVVVIN